MGELELDRLIDALVEELAVPVDVLVLDDPWLDALDTVLNGPLPSLPVWSAATESLVAEYTARMGGVR